MVRQAMDPRELAGVLVRPGLQGVTLPEAPAGTVRVREAMPALARARLCITGPAAAGPHALHALPVRKVRHGSADHTQGQTRCQFWGAREGLLRW